MLTLGHGERIGVGVVLPRLMLVLALLALSPEPIESSPGVTFPEKHPGVNGVNFPDPPPGVTLPYPELNPGVSLPGVAGSSPRASFDPSIAFLNQVVNSQFTR